MTVTQTQTERVSLAPERVARALARVETSAAVARLSRAYRVSTAALAADALASLLLARADTDRAAALATLASDVEPSAERLSDALATVRGLLRGSLWREHGSPVHEPSDDVSDDVPEPSPVTTYRLSLALVTSTPMDGRDVLTVARVAAALAAPRPSKRGSYVSDDVARAAALAADGPTLRVDFDSARKTLFLDRVLSRAVSAAVDASTQNASRDDVRDVAERAAALARWPKRGWLTGARALQEHTSTVQTKARVRGRDVTFSRGTVQLVHECSLESLLAQPMRLHSALLVDDKRAEQVSARAWLTLFTRAESAECSGPSERLIAERLTAAYGSVGRALLHALTVTSEHAARWSAEHAEHVGRGEPCECSAVQETSEHSALTSTELLRSVGFRGTSGERASLMRLAQRLATAVSYSTEHGHLPESTERPTERARLTPTYATRGTVARDYSPRPHVARAAVPSEARPMLAREAVARVTAVLLGSLT